MYESIPHRFLQGLYTCNARSHVPLIKSANFPFCGTCSTYICTTFCKVISNMMWLSTYKHSVDLEFIF